jgi:outer membrane protein
MSARGCSRGYRLPTYWPTIAWPRNAPMSRSCAKPWHHPERLNAGDSRRPIPRRQRRSTAGLPTPTPPSRARHQPATYTQVVGNPPALLAPAEIVVAICRAAAMTPTGWRSGASGGDGGSRRRRLDQHSRRRSSLMPTITARQRQPQQRVDPTLQHLQTDQASVTGPAHAAVYRRR